MSSLRLRRRRNQTQGAAAAAAASLLYSSSICHGFTINSNSRFSIRQCPSTAKAPHSTRKSSSSLNVYAPPGSGYVRSDTIEEDDDETAALSHPELTATDIHQISPSAFPKTYEPMLEYPGTMRPGRTPENMPYHDLPNLGINDPDPVPWPHFQEIEWHHRWDPPHEQALAMEEFIEVQGRWATVEEEAEMRMGMRRGVRERRENEELIGKGGVGGMGGGGEQVVIMDDEEEEEGSEGVSASSSSIGIGLGEGVEALLKGAADATGVVSGAIDDDDDDDEEDEGDEDDFLLDLGLGGDEDEDDEEEEEDEEEAPASKKKKASKKTVKMDAADEDDDDDDDDDDDLDLDFELGFDLDDDEDDDGVDDDDDDEDGDFDDYDDDDEDISLDDYTKEDDGGDDDEFDDGGFDYGD